MTHGEKQCQNERRDPHYITVFVRKTNLQVAIDTPRNQSHHAVSSQEVGEDLSVNVVHEASWTLVVISSINKELLTGVLINQGADLETRQQLTYEKVQQVCFFMSCKI